MKSGYPGDSEFSYSNFWSLPYLYVVDAFQNLKKKEQLRYHNNEAPIALLTSLTANLNRDAKKRREPYTIEDFFLFQPKDFKDGPAQSYGSAAMALVELELFPSWALFVYKALKESSEGNAPSLLAFICEDAILLAPRENHENSIKSMFIGLESASGARRKMKSPCGLEVYMQLPKANGKAFAEEDVISYVIS